MEERISIAPMMEWTDSHWRSMIRGVTRKTVLYTEMVVDSTILHQNMHENFQMFIGKDIYEAPSVIQLGGNDPESMGHAASLLSDYGSYSELNLNCGCPSSRVKKFCFGASLMLQPELVREITYSMNRKSGLPVSVKCRIGVDDVDSYESLQEFVHTVSQSGVRKFVVHARKCLLSGLTTKQNRDIPPLKYEVVHKLVQDFPGYQFVVNGGVLDFESAELHLNDGKYDWRGVTMDLPPAAGVMIGRAVYNNPLLFATADSYFFNVSDPCLTRRQVIDRYLNYCDWIQSDNGPVCIVKGKRRKPGTTFLFKPLFNIFSGCSKSHKWRTAINDVTLDLRRTGSEPSPREVIDLCIDEMDEEVLDAEIGKRVEKSSHTGVPSNCICGGQVGVTEVEDVKQIQGGTEVIGEDHVAHTSDSMPEASASVAKLYTSEFCNR